MVSTDPALSTPDDAPSSTPMRLFRWVALGGVAGGWAGFFVGGGLGRIAMFVLRLTSDDRLHGHETDDGFTIGKISSSTFFLMGICAIFGAIAGVVYVAGRWAVPARYRVLVAGVIGSLLGGARILSSTKFDFRAIEPHVLSVVMFIVIPGVAMASIAWLVERWSTWFLINMRRTGVVSAPFVFPLFPVAFLVAALGLFVVPLLAAAARSSRVRSALTRFGPRLGQAALVVVASLSAWVLTNDVTAIL